MERNHYIHYTAADLLNDGPFLDSMQHPTEQSEDFWARLEKEDSDFAKELHMARSFLKIVAVSPQKQMTDDEVGILWERISYQVAVEKKQEEEKTINFPACSEYCCLYINVGLEQLFCFFPYCFL